MLDDLRRQAQEKLKRSREAILKDPEAAEYFSAYRRLTGSADIFTDMPESLSEMKRQHAGIIRDAFMKKVQAMPEFRAMKEAEALVQAYSEEGGEKEGGIGKESHESGELAPPGGIWDEDRVQVIDYVEDDPFAFLDEGLEMKVRDPAAPKEDDLIDLEPDAPVMTISESQPATEEAEPQAAAWTPEPEAIARPTIEDIPEPSLEGSGEQEVPASSEEDEEERGSLVTSEGISQYNRITNDIEEESRREEIEKSSFVDGINVESAGIEETGVRESGEVPGVMYYKGKPVSQQEYDRLVREEQESLAAQKDGIKAPEPAEGAEPAFGDGMQNAADFNEDIFGDNDSPDRSATIARFAERKVPGVIQEDGPSPEIGTIEPPFNEGPGIPGAQAVPEDAPEPEDIPEPEFGDLPEPPEDLVNGMMEAAEPEEPEEPDIFAQAQNGGGQGASESCIENLENFMGISSAAEEDILERTAKANPMNEPPKAEPPAREKEERKEEPRQGKGPKKNVHSWNLEGMFKAT